MYDEIKLLTHWQFIQQYPGVAYIDIPAPTITIKEVRILLSEEDYNDSLFYRDHYNVLDLQKPETDWVTKRWGNPPTIHHWYFGLSAERRSNMEAIHIAIFELN
mgnify:CR=1 FL=1